MSVPQVPSRVRPQPEMSLSSMITSLTVGEMRIASICAPFSVKPRMITYGAFTVMLYCWPLAASSVEPVPS
jgi:hypothetical protein